jgi:hypothetical protein
MCDGAFLTTEYTYDARMLKCWFLEEINKFPNLKVLCGSYIKTIDNNGEYYVFKMGNRNIYKTRFVLNATYAGINQIHALLGFPALQIKYELCEIIICEAKDKLKNVGITVMDGAFFSIMPFGKTGYHSLTSVTFTPHITCYDNVPTFTCQSRCCGFCSSQKLGNCNNCPAKPESMWPYMEHLAKKYLKDEYGFSYINSLYSIKPILRTSEIDDSRPTVIHRYNDSPRFVSVLSGKINTVYELDGELIQAKSHSYIHSSLNYVMWFMGYIQIGTYFVVKYTLKAIFINKEKLYLFWKKIIHKLRDEINKE